VAAAGLVQAPPQVFILDWLLVSGLPAPGLPAANPFSHALHDVFAVGVQIDAAGPFQRLQRHDGRHQFHAVVGGQSLAAPEFLLMAAAGLQDGAPAAGARVALAGAVGVDDDVIVRIHGRDAYSLPWRIAITQPI